VTFARPEHRFGRALRFERAGRHKGRVVVVRVRRFAMAKTGSWQCVRLKQERGALLIALFFHLFPSLFSLFPVLLFACSAVTSFPSRLQWLFLYFEHFGAL
jgi:hypothetical protein